MEEDNRDEKEQDIRPRKAIRRGAGFRFADLHWRAAERDVPFRAEPDQCSEAIRADRCVIQSD